jgi:hypothetical protein
MKRKKILITTVLIVVPIMGSFLFFHQSNAESYKKEIQSFRKQKDTATFYKNIPDSHKALLNQLSAELDYISIEHFSYRVTTDQERLFRTRFLNNYSVEFSPQLLHFTAFSNPEGVRVTPSNDSINKYFFAEMSLYIDYDSTQWVQQYVLVSTYMRKGTQSPIQIVKPVVRKIDYRSETEKHKLITAAGEAYSKLRKAVLTELVSR